jgi:hypothetical protein
VGGTVFVPVPTPPIEVDFVDLELVNTSDGSVDPGIFIDGVEQIIDPPLDPGEVVEFTVDCFLGTVVESDAFLFTTSGPLLSDNAPLLIEGVDFFCGDLISFVYIRDFEGFFTQVEITAGF